MNKYFIQYFQNESTLILPNFGALTMTNEDTKEVMFLPYLNYDDGKLAAFIAETDGVDVTEATNQISKYVREISMCLDKGDTFDIYGFGSFKKNSAGEILFVAEDLIMGDVQNQTRETEIVPNDQSEDDNFSSVTLDTNAEIKQVVSSEELLSQILNQRVPSDHQEPEMPVSFDISEDESKLEPDQEMDQAPDLNSEDSALVNDSKKDEQPIVTDSFSSSLHAEDTTAVPPREKKVVEKKIKSKKHANPPRMEENVLIDVKPKKKRKLNFASVLLMFFIVIFVGAGVWAYLNFDQVRPHLPFLAEKKEYKSIMNSDEDHIKVMKELSGMTEEETAADEVEVIETQPKPESRKVATPIVTKSQKSTLTNVGKAIPSPVVKESKPSSSSSIASIPVKPAPVENVSTSVKGSLDGEFYLIVGSFSSAENAGSMAKKLASKGFASQTMPRGEMTMVSAGGFSTSAEAQQFLDNNKSALGGGWVFKK